MNTFIKYFLMLSLVSVLYYGCSEETDPINPGITDTSAANFNNLLISERTIPFDLSLSAVNLFTGLIVQDSSSNKDANIVDSLFANDSVYFFRSGDLSDFPSQVPGYRTRFVLISLNSTQAQFDTMKTIPDSDTTLSENDFTMDNTNSFTAPLLFHSVYGFYLKGKYDNNVTPYPVYGLLYLDESFNESTGFKLRFDVKINKEGKNKFKSQ
ncbi:MAG: hypothetical protein ABI543_02815 [Ignavibacteria bacterium]